MVVRRWLDVLAEEVWKDECVLRRGVAVLTLSPLLLAPERMRGR